MPSRKLAIRGQWKQQTLIKKRESNCSGFTIALPLSFCLPALNPWQSSSLVQSKVVFPLEMPAPYLLNEATCVSPFDLEKPKKHVVLEGGGKHD